MVLSISICIGAFFVLLWWLRRDSISLGLPIAYLFSLLLIHVPGAYVHVATDYLPFTDMVAAGIRFTAIGSVCFVLGVMTAGYLTGRGRIPAAPEPDSWKFSMFCLVGGWFFTYGLSSLHSIPSLGAAVDRAGGIWMLGVVLGMRAAMQKIDLKMVVFWFGALMVYPILMLLLGGFLSYGSAAVIVVLSALTIPMRSPLRLLFCVVVTVFLGLNVFVNYFAHRDEIRDEVWGRAPLEDRVNATLDVFRDFKWFDSDNPEQVTALNARLNQNYFAGLAAARINAGSVDYLYGRSLWEGVFSFVPRALWPEKPVVAGSPMIVAEMTGLTLNKDTSFGVGNVMEFQINFGIPGLVIGFFVLGFLIRAFDKRAAKAIRSGDFGGAIVGFLTAVALIQPNGSIVELCMGSAGALGGALGWRWLWGRWSGRSAKRAHVPRRLSTQPIGHRYPRP